MDLAIQLDDGADVPVISLRGELDLATMPRVHDAFVRLAVQRPGATVIADLDGLSSLDDAGIGALVGGLGRMRSTGGDLVVVCAGRLLEQLRLCRLDQIFAVHATLEAARQFARAG